MYAEPGATVYPALEGAPTGLTGTLAVRVTRDSDAVVVVARTTVGISEQPVGSGHYIATIVAPLTEGEYSILWDHGSLSPTMTATEDLTVTFSLLPDAAASPTYTTPILVRDELGLDEDALPDATAIRLIVDAEDLIDEALGARSVDDDSGRKVVQADVDAWRWVKLRRAATKATARLYKNPGLEVGREWQSETQPGRSASGPTGTSLANMLGDQVMGLLNQSGLRRMSVGGRGSRPPWHDFAVNDNSWDIDEVRR